MGKVIGVVSLKGGVGKTSVVTALGDAMSDFGKKVLLVDANLSAPNLGLHLNVIDPEITLHDVLAKKANVHDAIHNLDNFDIIPSNVFNRHEVNPLLLRDKIKSLRDKYDVILIDSSPTLGDETLAVMLASDCLMVVTTPDYPTLSTTLKAVKLAKQRGTDIDGLIINKVHDKDFELGFEDIEETVGVPVMGIIPHDTNVLRALSEFTPSTRKKPNSRASNEYRKLGGVLVGEKYRKKKLRDLFRKGPRKHEINREIYYSRVFD